MKSQQIGSLLPWIQLDPQSNLPRASCKWHLTSRPFGNLHLRSPKILLHLFEHNANSSKSARKQMVKAKLWSQFEVSLTWRANIQQEWLTLLTMLQCGDAWTDIYLSDMTASSKNRFCFTGSQRRSLNVRVLLIFMIKLPGSAVKFCTDCSLQIFLF